MATGSSFSFEIPATPDNKEALRKLRDMCMGGEATLYVESVDGSVRPVANISRHPECPVPVYEAFVRRLVNAPCTLTRK